jgi:hypothetical protein
MAGFLGVAGAPRFFGRPVLLAGGQLGIAVTAARTSGGDDHGGDGEGGHGDCRGVEREPSRRDGHCPAGPGQRSEEGDPGGDRELQEHGDAVFESERLHFTAEDRQTGRPGQGPTRHQDHAQGASSAEGPPRDASEYQSGPHQLPHRRRQEQGGFDRFGTVIASRRDVDEGGPDGGRSQPVLE